MANNMSVFYVSLSLCHVFESVELPLFMQNQQRLKVGSPGSLTVAAPATCHSLLIATFVGLFWQHRVLLTHSGKSPTCTYPRFDAVGLLGTDNHPLTVAVSTEATASAPIVGYPTAEEADKWLVEYTKVDGAKQ